MSISIFYGSAKMRALGVVSEDYRDRWTGHGLGNSGRAGSTEIDPRREEGCRTAHTPENTSAADVELQAWILEIGPAEIKDLPTAVTDVDSIVNIMTHMCYLGAAPAGLLRVTNKAAATFLAQMDAFSEVVHSRSFDANRISQGIPPIQNAPDPNRAPYWVTI
ncbi:hypothetical protein F5B21DRAFT_522941 [Xylaria acuta]|nr:hypothetical protein F5B21DRAFT_522941 [Xylaria acuta]